MPCFAEDAGQRSERPEAKPETNKMSNVSNFPDGKKSHKTSNKMTDKISCTSSQKSESKGPDELTVTPGSLEKVGIEECWEGQTRLAGNLTAQHVCRL